MRTKLAIALVPLGVVASCSDPHRPPALGDPPVSTVPTSIPTSGGEAGPPRDGGLNDGGSCGALPLFGVDVTEEFVPMDPPTPKGGALVFGTYRLFAAQDYTGFGGQSGFSTTKFRETVVLTASEITITSEYSGSAATTETYSYAIGADPIVLELALQCNSSPTSVTRMTFAYTIDQGILTLQGGSKNHISNSLAKM